MLLKSYHTLVVPWVFLMFSCRTLKESKYSAFNEFIYTKDQPSFHFKNDTLGIEGEFHWATHVRNIPKVSYLDTDVKKILKPISRKHGAILFSTWWPNRKKYSVEGYVEVNKKDVRIKNPYMEPFYVFALISDHAFLLDTSTYQPKGRNNDYQFNLFAKTPKLTNEKYWVMEVVASYDNGYYNFVCVMDKSFISNENQKEGQGQLFLEDIKTRFYTQDNF